MKKMRKFAWIFMAAMTVAGFSACSNTEDDPLPGLGGGDGDGSGSSVVITDTIYQFNNLEADYTSINELCPEWTHEIISPADDNRTWQGKIFTSNTDGSVDKYMQATAHDGSDKNAGKTYELWMISPALNVKDATNKVFSFYSEGAYWQSTSSLEVYILNEPKSTASGKEKLDVTLATSSNPGGNFKGWVASGDISLEGKGDIVYIGFRYQAQGGKSNSTTYCIDDFAFGRLQTEHYVEKNEVPSVEPEYKLVTDTIYTFDNIVAQYTPINVLCPEWRHEIISPSDDDRTWQSKTYNDEKYIQATAHDSSDGNAGKTYELWMISPALNVKDATNKVFSFYSEGAYWQNTSSLEVYVLNEPTSTASSKEKLDVTLATSSNPGGNFKGWVASGDISLANKGDIVYIGFRYCAQGGNSNSTTYCIDDFAFGRAQVDHVGGSTGGGTDTPDTPGTDVDWSTALSVADALSRGEEVVSVKGYIVGTLKKGCPGSIADVATAASYVEMQDAETYTGYSTVIIADNADETDLSKCLWVKTNDNKTEFPGAAGMTTDISLDKHPENIGKVLYVQGTHRAMFTGLPGVRGILAWELGE